MTPDMEPPRPSRDGDATRGVSRVPAVRSVSTALETSGAAAAQRAAEPPIADALATMLMRAVQDRTASPVEITRAPPHAVLQRGKSEKERAAAAKARNRPRRIVVTQTQVPVRSSKLRFFRRIQLRFGGSRNIGMVKLVNGKGKQRRVRYVIARSMGMGNQKLTLGDEQKTTSTGTLRRRGHSEALLRAVREKAKLNVKGTTVDLSDWRPEYIASTNEACGADHENCASHSVPLLGTNTMYFANPYGGSADAGGFEKENNAFQSDVRNDADSSEDESEDEAEMFVVDDEALQGVDVADINELKATRYQEYLANNLGGTKKTRRGGDTYDDEGTRL